MQIESESKNNFSLFELLVLLLAIAMNVFAYVFPLLHKSIIVCVNVMFLVISGFKVKLARYHLALFGFIIFAAISLSWTPHNVNVMVIPTLGYCLISVIMIHTVLKTEDQYITLLKGIIVSAYVLLLTLVFKYGIYSLLSTRMDNSMLNSNRAGTIFSFSLFFSIFLFFKERKIKYLFLSIPLIIFVFLCGSKSALVIAILSVTVMILLKDGNTSQKVIKNSLFVVLLIIIGYTLMMKIPVFYNIIGARFQNFLEVLLGKQEIIVGKNSNYMRISLAQFGIKNFLESPIFGHGLDSFRYAPGNPFPGFISHMNYVELLYNLGILGFLLYYAPFICLILCYFRIGPFINRIEGAFILGFIVYYSVYGFMGIFFNDLLEWIILELFCSFTLMKYKECKQVR